MIRWQPDYVDVYTGTPDQMNRRWLSRLRWAVIPEDTLFDGDSFPDKVILIMNVGQGQSETNSFDPEALWIASTPRFFITQDRVSEFFGTDPTWGLAMRNLGSLPMPSANQRRNLANYWMYNRQQAVFGTALLRKAEELWPRCTTCNAWGAHTHMNCFNCGQEANADTLISYQYRDNEAESSTRQRICQSCANEWANTLPGAAVTGNSSINRCYRCQWMCSDRGSHFVGADEYALCFRCSTYADYYGDCGNCGYFTSELHEGLCDDCIGARDDHGEIHYWDYRPDLIFHPSTPADPKKPLYIGMELETSFLPGISLTSVDIREWLALLPEDLIYVKSDSSVHNGFEIVTHPFQPRWGLENFPFIYLNDLLDLGAYNTHPSCGTHVHMNKEAFTTNHLWKFLQIHFRMPEFCQLVGGRLDNSYASFGIDDVRLQRQNIMEIVKKKGEEIQDYDRYCAINLRNEYTIELRYMRGGSSPNEMKKNIEWALALYEYSDYITVADVRNGAIDKPGNFLWWIYEGDYPQLQEWLSERIPQPVPLLERV